jgi:hypothetical protein
MGPQEKRLTAELAVYLVRSCSRALLALPPGQTLDIEARRRWFERAYREWQLTPRVDLAGRSPFEVIAAERAAARTAGDGVRPEPTIELYTDLPGIDFDGYPGRAPAHSAPGLRGDTADTLDGDDKPAALTPTDGEPRATPAPSLPDHAWRRFAGRLFGTWLDADLDRL